MTDIDAGHLVDVGTEPSTPEAVAVAITDQLPRILAAATPLTWERALLALGALHEVDERGRCRVCVQSQPGPRRWPWWRRRESEACPTRRVMWVELSACLDSRAGR